MMDKTYIYNQARIVPQEARQNITAGRQKGKTSINPMWRIKKLTELFGAAGVGWKFDLPIFEEKQGAKGEVVVQCYTSLYIRTEDGAWSAAIPGIGGAKLIVSEKEGLNTDDDAYKKAYTDAQSVACKALGIGADVYFENDKQPAHEPPQEYVCACCGNSIGPVKSSDGTIKRTAEEVARYTKEKYKRILCWTCAQKQPKEDGGLKHA